MEFLKAGRKRIASRGAVVEGIGGARGVQDKKKGIFCESSSKKTTAIEQGGEGVKAMSAPSPWDATFRVGKMA